MTEFVDKEIVKEAIEMIANACLANPRITRGEIQTFFKGIPTADVRPVAEILNAVDEAIIFLNNASNQMPYHVYSALYDLIYEICPNCGADMMGGDAE